MNLWIRNQSQTTFLNVNCIKIVENMIYGYHDKEYNLELLGEYKTNERALEVLDEIQNLFNFSIRNETFEKSDLIIKVTMLPKVYEMPKE